MTIPSHRYCYISQLLPLAWFTDSSRYASRIWLYSSGSLRVSNYFVTNQYSALVLQLEYI